MPEYICARRCLWCSATRAAAQSRSGPREAVHIALLLDNILPGLRDLPPELAPEEEARAAVEANVRWSIHQLRDTPEVKARMVEGSMKLVGAIYELESGRVRFLP